MKIKHLLSLFKVDDSAKDDDQPSHPGLVLKYSAYKNLASLAEKDSDDDKAVDLYLEVLCRQN